MTEQKKALQRRCRINELIVSELAGYVRLQKLRATFEDYGVLAKWMEHILYGADKPEPLEQTYGSDVSRRQQNIRSCVSKMIGIYAELEELKASPKDYEVIAIGMERILF